MLSFLLEVHKDNIFRSEAYWPKPFVRTTDLIDEMVEVHLTFPEGMPTQIGHIFVNIKSLFIVL
jgi:hypothetical protein